MNTEERVYRVVVLASWVILALAVSASLFTTSGRFTLGVALGGLLVCGNFTLLERTLKKALVPGGADAYNAVLAKYYLRFILSGVIILLLLMGRLLHPIGLIIGLSVMVAGIFSALIYELVLMKEAS